MDFRFVNQSFFNFDEIYAIAPKLASITDVLNAISLISAVFAMSDSESVSSATVVVGSACVGWFR